MIIAWCKGYGIYPTNVYMIDEVAMKVGGTSRNPNLTKFLDILKKVQTSDLKVYKETICDLIMDDTCFISEQYFESAKKTYQDKLSSVSYSKLTLKNLPGLIYNSLGAYENSKVFCDRYVTDEIVANVTARCQEIKNTFAQRIQRNTWMSEASKTNALDKLNAITINAGKPDSWYSEGLTDIASNTCLLQDVMQLRKTKANLYKALCNKPTKEAGMHIMASENRGLTVLNAFYHQNYIGIYIMPVFCLPPLYDITANEAEQYALATVFGHEFTHGFDSSGANFSKDGLYGPIWGTETDKKKFEELGKQYADYFSTLLVMPDELPGIYCDGTYTLTETLPISEELPSPSKLTTIV